MKKSLQLITLLALLSNANAQTNPAITSWLQNTTKLGSYYTSGNSTAASNNIVANVQSVKYSASYVYVATNGIPTYPTGPFLDGNTNKAGSQNAIYKISLNPTKNTGTQTATGLGNIGILINGVSIFNYSDAVSWNNAQSKFCGGPIQGCTGDGVWNRDAIVYEKAGFDCSKGHPAGTNYHHHQNPSAFKLDKTVISTICNLYDADALYAIDSTKHSPLIGYALDGFPIYGAYAYKNTDGTGGIVRMKSSYQLRNITTRTSYSNGSTVTAGPAVSSTYPLGSFQEDYEYVANSGSDYLDASNGRICKTPEYPNGIYCYFMTVDANWNSAYPYIIGPKYYGVANATKVTSITESTTTYTGTSSISNTEFNDLSFNIIYSQDADLVAIQANGLVKDDLEIRMYDLNGKEIAVSSINKGSTISFVKTNGIYDGIYIIKIVNGMNVQSHKVLIQR
jgi:hypothetical protein